MAQTEKSGARVHKPVGTDVSTARRVSRLRRHNRLRKRVGGTPERPRLVVNRSSRHIHVQVVDDTVGRTLVSASTLDASLRTAEGDKSTRSEEHTSELQSRQYLVCRLLLEKKKK